MVTGTVEGVDGTVLLDVVEVSPAVVLVVAPVGLVVVLETTVVGTVLVEVEFGTVVVTATVMLEVVVPGTVVVDVTVVLVVDVVVLVVANGSAIKRCTPLVRVPAKTTCAEESLSTTSVRTSRATRPSLRGTQPPAPCS